MSEFDVEEAFESMEIVRSLLGLDERFEYSSCVDWQKSQPSVCLIYSDFMGLDELFYRFGGDVELQCFC